MYKYTPKKSVLRDLQVSRTGAWWDKEYYKRMEVLKAFGADSGYAMCTALARYYKGVCFYSPTPRREIPVNGLLFPVAMFNEDQLKGTS